MKSKKTLFSFGLFFAFVLLQNTGLISMPPGTTTLPVLPPPPTLPAPVVPGVPPAPPAGTVVAGQLIAGAAAPAATPPPLVLVYTTEDQIVAALSESASPSLPLFAKLTSEKSKFDIYMAIFKALTPTFFQQISFDTKSKIFLGLVFDLVTPVIKTNDISLKNLTDARDLLIQSATFIKQTRDAIGSLRTTEAEKLKTSFRDIDNNTQIRTTEIKTKIAVQEDFAKRLTSIQLATTSFEDKIKAYQISMIPFLSKKEPILKSLLDDFINSLGRLVSTAETDVQKKSLSKFFNALLLEKMLTDPAKVKIKEFVAILEKPAGAGAPIPAAGAVHAGPATPAALGVPAASPAAAVAASITTPSRATPAPQTQQPNVVQEFKNKLDAAGKDYKNLIATCMSGLDLFAQNMSAADKQTLTKLIENALLSTYNARFSFIKNKSDILVDFDKFLDKAKTVIELKSIIPDQKINTVKVALLLNEALANKQDFAKISSDLKKVVEMMVKDIDDYEKTRTKDALDSLFSNRKVMNINTLSVFKALLDYLVLPNFKNKNIFSASIQSQFDIYSKVINATVILLQPLQSKEIKSQIDYYKPALGALGSTETDYEKKLFMEAIETIFAYRGNCLNTELNLIKTFLETMLAKTGVFSVDQRRDIDSWLIELKNAITTTSENKRYLETLIENYMSVQTFADNYDKYYKKVFLLFTIDTPKTIVNLFIQKLNDLFLNRDKIDKKKLQEFLTIKKDTVDKTGVNKISSLLGAPQKVVLKTWVNTLKDEIEAQKKASATQAPAA